MDNIKQRYLELDALRGIAALMVVFFHYSVRYGQIYGNPVEPLFKFDLGMYGVQLFFIISGFVIFLTLEKTTHALDFVVSRFSRLYPAYWTAVGLTFSIVYLFSLPGRQVDIETAFVNLTMIQVWFKYGNVDGVYWTLAVELSFYLIMLFLFIARLIHKIEIISILWLAAIAGYAFVEKNGIAHIHWAINMLLVLNQANLFIAGIMFFRIIQGARLIHYLVLALCLAIEYYLRHHSIFFVGGCFLAFFLLSKQYLGFLAVKPLVFLGTISYSLYLTHQNIGYVIINGLRKFDALNAYTILAVPLTISIILAATLQRYIEKPALVFLRHRWQSSRLRGGLTGEYHPIQ